MKRFLGRLALLTSVAVGLVALFASPALAAKTIYATIAASCNGQPMTGGTFTLSGVDNGQRITVNDGSARDYSPGSYNATTRIATYTMAFDGPLDDPPAVATVSSDWSGSFSLTRAQCAAPKPPSITTNVNVCGVEPVLSVRLTNNNPVSVRYTVNLTTQAARSTELSAGESEEVTYPSLPRGAKYTLAVTAKDGTNVTRAVDVPACQAAAPAPVNKKPTTSTKKAANAAAEPTAASSASASPSPEPTGSSTVRAGNDDWDDPLAGSLKYWVSCTACALVFLCLIPLWWRRRRKAAKQNP